jgi:hypothetical protein
MVSYPHKSDGGTILEMVKPVKFLTYACKEYYDNDPRFKREQDGLRDQDFLNGVEWVVYSHDILKDLESRGYDPKTFKIEIKIDPKNLKEKFNHLYIQLTDEEKLKLGIN